MVHTYERPSHARGVSGYRTCDAGYDCCMTQTRVCQRPGCTIALPADATARRQFCSGNCKMAVLRARRPKHPSRRCPDLTGQQIGALTVVERGPNKGPRAQFLCQCSCGTRKTIDASSLRIGRRLDCGCATMERMIGPTNPSYRHGLSAAPEYVSFHAMRARCLDETHKSYAEYGGRGITICAAWDNFEQFYADMGPRPSLGHTLDRIDNSRGYSPDNCRWATAVEQNNNRRRARVMPQAKLTEDAVRKLRAEAAAGTAGPQLATKYGLSVGYVYKVVRRKTWRHVP